jgi:RNA polymerase sigma factor (sigma-70 family)
MPLPGEMSEANKAVEKAALHHRGLYHFALALCRRDRQEALDVVQQTYLEVLEGRADLVSAMNPRAYLFGVARRVAASRRRRRSIWGRIAGLALVKEPQTTVFSSPEREAQAEEDVRRVNKALDRLKGRQLEVVTLVFAEGLTVEEAAAAMGVSVGSARIHYARAKNRLKDLLKEDGHAV